ncbi:recombinase RecT [Streptobacillus moniliformis]|uniref:recombinase RecT n=1 Tax=Streptobacillus moniliformis TaxID=34105 RepID=UPI0007E3228D|nr:recombinase RecT [Streptobacillus moniliformis]
MSRLEVSNKEKKTLSLKEMIGDVRTKDKFNEILGQKAPKFLNSLLNMANNDKLLKGATPQSIILSAMNSAVLDLPIEKNLGYTYIVPYKNKGVLEAQFQMGYKGYIQLAMRSSQYLKINVAPLYKGQFKQYDPIKDELIYDLNNKESEDITHYVAYFKTINGFEKYLIMSKQEILEHKKRYSKAGDSAYSPWSTQFDLMAMKTVLKLLLSRYGILSTELQTAIKTDSAVIKEINRDNDVEVEYVDEPTNFDDIEAVNTVEEYEEEIF